MWAVSVVLYIYPVSGHFWTRSAYMILKGFDDFTVSLPFQSSETKGASTTAGASYCYWGQWELQQQHFQHTYAMATQKTAGWRSSRAAWALLQKCPHPPGSVGRLHMSIMLNSWVVNIKIFLGMLHPSLNWVVIAMTSLMCSYRD